MVLPPDAGAGAGCPASMTVGAETVWSEAGLLPDRKLGSFRLNAIVFSGCDVALMRVTTLCLCTLAGVSDADVHEALVGHQGLDVEQCPLLSVVVGERLARPRRRVGVAGAAGVDGVGDLASCDFFGRGNDFQDGKALAVAQVKGEIAGVAALVA